MSVYHFHRPQIMRLLVYQLRAVVDSPEGIPAALLRLIRVVVPFAAQNVGMEPPDSEKSLNGFLFNNIEQGSQCECVCIPDQLIWTIRFRFLSEDRTYTWFYDIGTVQENDQLVLGIRIEVTSGPDVKVLQKNLPLIDLLINEFNLTQMLPLKNNYLKIEEPEDVQNLLALLNFPGRTIPVMVISEINRNLWDYTKTPPSYLIDAEYVASQVVGYAFVARLSFRAGYEFSSIVGKKWAVYDGAYRTYLPYLDLENGNPHEHRTKQKRDIWNWRYKGQIGPDLFADFVISTAHYWITVRRLYWGNLRFVPDVSTLATQLALEELKDKPDADSREETLKNVIATLRRSHESTMEELNQAIEELDRVYTKLDYCETELRNYQQAEMYANSMDRGFRRYPGRRPSFSPRDRMRTDMRIPLGGGLQDQDGAYPGDRMDYNNGAHDFEDFDRPSYSSRRNSDAEEGESSYDSVPSYSTRRFTVPKDDRRDDMAGIAPENINPEQEETDEHSPDEL